jgi:CHAT domain-containing protein
VMDAVSSSLTTLRQRFALEDQKAFDQLNSLNTQLAELMLNGPQNTTLAEHQKQVAARLEEKESVEARLSRLSAGYYTSSTPITLSEIQSQIPADGAIIEFTLYHPFAAKAPEKAYRDTPAHYLAYLIFPKGEIKWAELGEAKAIDEAINAWRKALRDPERKDVQQGARAVDEKIMQPLRPLLGAVRHLLLSPDGALNLIPFEALTNQQGRYLIEDYLLTYVTSGRDLLRLSVTRNAKFPLAIFADPFFGELPQAKDTLAKDTPMEARVAQARNRSQKRQSVVTGNQVERIYFAPLSGTAAEAEAIRAQFPQAMLLTGSNATEAALKKVTAPQILHIATHGFFLTDDATKTNPKDTRSINARVKIENPLLRAGLALAGANFRQQNNEDGILTALEASGLNLWGTKLVTLSACDTGLGEVKNGEGVYGLRRAFMLAGTESLVMSLWPVNDSVTRALMTGYYQGLQRGLGRSEALRKVQLQMLTRKSRAHPFYWASFIQAGEWANLNGQR